MPNYKYTDDEFRQLTSISSLDVALALGMEVDEYRSSSKAIHIKDSGGLFVFPQDGKWYRHSDEKSGHGVQLVCDTLGCSFGEALDWLARNIANITASRKQQVYYKNRTPFPKSEIWTAERTLKDMQLLRNDSSAVLSEFHSDSISYQQQRKTESRAEFRVPPHDIPPRRVFAYLIKTRGIDADIVKDMVQRKLIAEDSVHHNCLFFGKDKDGTIRSCAMRGTTSAPFRGEVSGGDKRYTFCIKGSSNTAYFYESPIDALSHATLLKMNGQTWATDSRVSTNGCGGYIPAQHFLDDNPFINDVVIAYDNDEKGIQAAERIAHKLRTDYADRNINVRTLRIQQQKDMNEVLQLYRRCSDIVSVEEFMAEYISVDGNEPSCSDEECEDEDCLEP